MAKVSQAAKIGLFVVVTAGAGYLVLSDAYFPGWTATLDGQSVTIYQADLAFRAVYLPDAGDHTIVFRFQPQWWTIGWGVAGLTTVVILAVLVVPLIVSRRRR